MKGLFNLKQGESYHSPFLAEMKRVCQENNLNYYKVLCLNWQHNTKKKCTNRNHQKGEYKDKMECEAQLTETIAIMGQTFGITKAKAKKYWDERMVEVKEKLT